MSDFVIGANQRKWLDALRSGHYAQGRENLRYLNSHCCLGVGCELFGIEGRQTFSGTWRYGSQDTGGCAPDELMDALALRSDTGEAPKPKYGERPPSLVTMNDEKRYTFDQIADAVERDPGAYFKESR